MVSYVNKSESGNIMKVIKFIDKILNYMLILLVSGF